MVLTLACEQVWLDRTACYWCSIVQYCHLRYKIAQMYYAASTMQATDQGRTSYCAMPLHDSNRQDAKLF